MRCLGSALELGGEELELLLRDGRKSLGPEPELPLFTAVETRRMSRRRIATNRAMRRMTVIPRKSRESGSVRLRTPAKTTLTPNR
jgi:hypothetical protein